MRRMLAIALLLAMAVAACGAGDDVTGTTTGGGGTVGGDQETPIDPTDASLPRNTVPDRFDPAAQPIEGGTPTTGEVPDRILSLLLEDAGTQADGSPYDVVLAEVVVWSDGSLGCPEPDVMYTQALVDGYRVVLQGDEGAIDYRVGQNDFFFRCERTGTTPAGIGTIGGGSDPGQPTG